MPRIAANLTMLFTEVPFAERFRQAAAVGFKGVECLFPYEHAKEEIRAWLDAAGLEQVLFNAPSGDWQNGERGLCCLPDRKAEFREAIGRAIEYAGVLGCPRVHVPAGLAPEAGPERAPFEETYRQNLAYAADQFAAHGITTLMEPINGKRDAPGFFLQTTTQARAIIAELGRDNLKLQFDVYHVQIMQGDLVQNFRDSLPDIGHVQIANPPARHEPDDGEINYPYLFQVMDEAGYDGWVSCEYIPRAGTVAGLGWAAAYGIGTG